MTDHNGPDGSLGVGSSGVSRRGFLQRAAGGALVVAGGSLLASDQVLAAKPGGSCPHSVPVVNENRCTDPNSWTTAFQLQNFDGAVCGFATKTSVNRGQAVSLKLISYGNARKATLRVYRLGYYNGKGGRLVHELRDVPLPTFAQQGDATNDPRTGLRACKSWTVSATVPASATGVSGMYLVKIVAENGAENHIPFIVRDDARARDLLVALPTNTWQAYNNWAGKSLYVYNSSDAQTIAGSSNGRSRAVKASFDRPLLNVAADYNWVLRTEFPLIYWLERQGYDLSYTDDFGLHSQADQLARAKTKTLVITGHSEYWTKEAFDNVQAARDGGTNIASFSANTAYWQVRYEDAGRTLVCFKTVQGNDADGDGTLGVNDFGPGAEQRGGPNDPLGPDGIRGGGDDKPQYSTTTFRDPGAAPGDNAPNDPQLRGRGRVGPNRSENGLFGVLYIGDDDAVSYGLHVSAGAGNGGEFGAHPAWRRTSVANQASVDIGKNIVGWEWDAVPGSSTPYAARQPAGVKRLSSTNPSNIRPAGNEIAYLQDFGRRYGSNPPPGQSGSTHAITYAAPSGAKVFASGTMQWSWGLGPHYLDKFWNTYRDARVDSSDPRIQQCTYNLLSDMGVQPKTPEGISLD